MDVHASGVEHVLVNHLAVFSVVPVARKTLQFCNFSLPYPFISLIGRMHIHSPCGKWLLLPVLALAFIGYLGVTPAVNGQTAASEHVVVTGDDVTSAYGAPGGFSHARFAPLTSAYVLPPWTFYFGEIYEGDAFRHGLPDHLFTTEVEMGLPHRFGAAAEVGLERFK